MHGTPNLPTTKGCFWVTPTATPELVFSAGLNGKIRAYAADSGEILWQDETATTFNAANGISGHGGSIDVAGQVIVEGWLYVLSGYSMFGQLPGNMLLVYKIEQQNLQK